MGPQASKSYPGRRLVKPAGPKAEPQEIDYGRRDVAGYVFGALRPATGDAFTATYEGRTTANWIDFLGHVRQGGGNCEVVRSAVGQAAFAGGRMVRAGSSAIATPAMVSSVRYRC